MIANAINERSTRVILANSSDICTEEESTACDVRSGARDPEQSRRVREPEALSD
eukprot:m.206805 g.206805  ORF g.206805 m.206805 type:complete len:54 (+) comp15435_c0_seq4:2834-2995(+)